MNARLTKETRDLLPMFAGMLVLIVAPSLIWHDNAAVVAVVTFGLTCAVLGGCSFGNEFQHRTLSLLLSQPIARSVLWRDKMLVLGGGILASLAVLAVCLEVCCPGLFLARWPLLAVIALCAFCGTPYWTLLLRHGIGGMAFAAATPCALVGFNALVTERFSEDKGVEEISAAILMLGYFVVIYRRGYARFKQLEDREGAARELSLPAGVEAVLVRPLARVVSRFRGPFASLLRKELRLQQISLVLAGLFCLIAVGGFCLIRLHPELAEGIIGGDYMLYMLILPLVAGAVSVAEEKGWGLADWHLTLPPSALKQWSAKMLATLSTSLVLGFLLPVAMFAAGQALLRQLGGAASLPPVPQVLGWVIGSLLMTSVAVYAASFSTTTLRAILAAFGIIAVSISGFFLTGTWVDDTLRRLALRHVFHETDLVAPVLCGGLILTLCLIQWLAWSNFRRSGLRARRLVFQLLFIFAAIGLISVPIFTAMFLASVGRR